MKTYKSKFGYEIIIFLTITLGIIIGFMIYQNQPVETIILVGGIFALVYVFFLYLNFSTKYTITKDGILKVKCGVLYYKLFDIEKITSIKKSYNLISSPAPSLDRIELTYGKFDLIVISPKDEFEFANELIKKNPKIVNKLTK